MDTIKSLLWHKAAAFMSVDGSPIRTMDMGRRSTESTTQNNQWRLKVIYSYRTIEGLQLTCDKADSL